MRTTVHGFKLEVRQQQLIGTISNLFNTKTDVRCTFKLLLNIKLKEFFLNLILTTNASTLI